METLVVPARFGGVVAKKPYQAKCATCGDFGTVTQEQRRDTVAAIIAHEAACFCPAGDLWRRLKAEWSKPILDKQGKPCPKCNGKAAA